MNKQEFEERINSNVSNEDYTIIEYVYTNHPSISDVNGKDEIANIFKIGGMRLIRDMMKSAEIEENLHQAQLRLQEHLNRIKEIRRDLKAGEIVFLDEINDLISMCSK